MEVYIFQQDVYNRLYSCDYMNATEWSTFAMPRPYLGSICILLGITNLIAYLSCLSVMRKRKFYCNSCYKIMFFLGCMDSVCLVFNHFISGVFLATGTIFCLYPNLQYISGSIMVACWFGECIGCLIIAFNRCVEILFPQISVFLFEGGRTYLWISAMFLYAIFALFFVPPITLNSALIMWFYDPYALIPTAVVPVDRMEYASLINDLNTYVVIGSVVVLYVIIIIAVRIKAANSGKIHRQIFITALFICSLNVIAGFVYILLLLVPSNNFWLYVCLFAWMFSDGGGGLVLLVVNRTIRSEVKEMYRKRFFPKLTVVVVSSITTTL